MKAFFACVLFLAVVTISTAHIYRKYYDDKYLTNGCPSRDCPVERFIPVKCRFPTFFTHVTPEGKLRRCRGCYTSICPPFSTSTEWPLDFKPIYFTQIADTIRRMQKNLRGSLEMDKQLNVFKL